MLRGMSQLTLTREGNIFIVTMANPARANALSDETLKEHGQILDEIESSTDNGAVILTSADPKFWCNGIDLEWLMTQSSDYVPKFKSDIDQVLLRWALLPFPTIACITGHAFGAGAILSCAFDFRLMRKDRGFFCFPEVDIKIPFTDVMHTIINLLPDKKALWDLAFTGRRIGGEEAFSLQVVSGAYSQEELLPKTKELAKMLSEKDRATYSSLKRGLKGKMR